MILPCIILSDMLLNTDIPYRGINTADEENKTVNFEEKKNVWKHLGFCKKLNCFFPSSSHFLCLIAVRYFDSRFLNCLNEKKKLFVRSH